MPGRRMLALEAATALETLDPADRPGRAAVRRHLAEAGIVRVMHVGAMAIDDRDTAIDYALGEVIGLLGRQPAVNGGLRHEVDVLASYRDWLRELHDVPDPAPAPVDQQALALEVAGALDVLDPEDRVARWALLYRLAEAGVGAGGRVRGPAASGRDTTIDRYARQVFAFLSSKADIYWSHHDIESFAIYRDWLIDLHYLPDPAPAPVDRPALALQVATALTILDPSDRAGRNAVLHRLAEAGIDDAMHLYRMANSDRDKLIEFELGGLFGNLHARPSCHDFALERDAQFYCHLSERLLYLHDLPRPGVNPPGRKELAQEVAILLEVDDLADPARRRALVERLMHAGVLYSMHEEDARPAHLPSTGAEEDMRDYVIDRLIELFAVDITASEWPVDRRIEYCLGKLVCQLLYDPAKWDQMIEENPTRLTEWRNALRDLYTE